MSNTNFKLAKTQDFAIGKPELTAIFIHGIAADSSSFNSFFEYLRDQEIPGIRVVAYDLLGVGMSRELGKEYDLDEQMSALENSLSDLEISTPVTIVGHSMGTMLASRLAAKYLRIGKEQMITQGTPPEESGMPKQRSVAPDGTILYMVLISPPVYTADDIKNPLFKIAIDKFCDAVAERDPDFVKSKVFQNELNTIVENPENYDYLAHANTMTTFIYGKKDQIIASFNYPELLKKNPLIKTMKTDGAHGVSPEKFDKIVTAIKGDNWR